MNNRVQDQDIIDQYLFDRLDQKEKEKVEERIKNDPEFKKQMNWTRSLIIGVKQEFRSEIKKKLTEYELQHYSTFKPLNYWLIAASVVLIISSGVLWFFYLRDSPESIISKHDFYEPGIENVMNDKSSKRVFHQGMDAFKLEKYSEALAIFSLLLEENPENDTLNYYKGVSLLRLGEIENKATVESFQIVINSESRQFKEKAEFRLALILLVSGLDNKQLEELKKRIQHPNHLFNQKVDIFY